MKTKPIALQLYTVRDLLKEDFDGILGRIADFGYAGVETFGDLAPAGPKRGAGRLSQLGLTICSAHVALPLGEKQRPTLDLAARLGCRRVVASPGPEEFATAEAVQRTIDRINEAGLVAAAHGLQLALHNHWWEFQAVDGLVGGPYPYQAMLVQLSPEIIFELDTYWIASAGHDPAGVVALFGDRAPLLHIKDGPATADTDAPMVAVGDGRLDFPVIVGAAGANAEWLIVELDRCATDMMVAVEKSYNYLVEAGLGHGR